jgi:hypothetical protein
MRSITRFLCLRIVSKRSPWRGGEASLNKLATRHRLFDFNWIVRKRFEHHHSIWDRHRLDAKNVGSRYRVLTGTSNSTQIFLQRDRTVSDHTVRRLPKQAQNNEWDVWWNRQSN